MKTKWNFTLAVLSSLLLATTAYADDEVDEIDVCREFSLIAKEIMTARQDDKPMSETLPMAIDLFRNLPKRFGVDAESDLDGEGEFREAATELVMIAYDRPSYDLDELQQTEISNFENGVFSECYKASISDSEDEEE